VPGVAGVDVIGGEIRTGSTSRDGREVVVGTALILIGSNSRTVAAAVDAKMDIRRSLPAGVAVDTVLNRTQLVDATITTVAKNLGEGALLVIAALFLLLGNFRAALITALVIPLAMLMTAAGPDQRQPDEPRRARFRPHRRRRCHHQSAACFRYPSVLKR
jgi:cobalt-zinc-cadmium resistance protein CzcA